MNISSITRYFLHSIVRGVRHNYRNYKCYASTGILLYGKSAVFFDSKNISIGGNFSMGIDCKFYAQDKSAKIFIGDNVSLNDNVTINADNGGYISIGSDVMIGPGTIMRASNHNFGNISKPFTKQGHKCGIIKIKDNVWLGANVIVVPDVLIGNNVVIGAGSVVTRDIPDNSLAVGSPAKVIRTLI